MFSLVVVGGSERLEDVVKTIEMTKWKDQMDMGDRNG